MKKNKRIIVWVIKIIFLVNCSGKKNQLPFWGDNKNFIWDSYFANQTLENQQYQFMPNTLLVFAKEMDYPFLDWSLPFYEIYKPTFNIKKNAIKFGACLADLSYLSIYEKNLWITKYRNYADSLKMNLFNQYELPELYPVKSEHPDSIQVWIATQMASLELLIKTLQKNHEIKHYINFGAWLETLFLVSHIASFKEDPALFLKIEEHKKYLDYYQSFLMKFHSTEILGKEVNWINHQLIVTQTVNVWDSLENQFQLKTFPLKEPVINLQKNLSELRKKWILEN